jgi:hypothetical protein|tara:strand:- start:193 stop:459 length:267 start_codon:yes stop_codon:yes gene_type:complete
LIAVPEIEFVPATAKKPKPWRASHVLAACRSVHVAPPSSERQTLDESEPSVLAPPVSARRSMPLAMPAIAAQPDSQNPTPPAVGIALS